MSDITQYERPAITADCVLFTAVEKEGSYRGEDLGLQVRLVKRNNAPEDGKWALLGAFVPIDDRIEDVMRRAVREKGGYGQDFFAEQLFTFDTPGRDERWRVISVAYIGIIPMWHSVTQAAPDARWFYVDTDSRELYQPVEDITISFEDLAFDHGEILGMAIDRLRGKATYTDMILNFIDEPIAIKDIKRVMEAVTEKPCNNPQRMFSGYLERLSEEEQLRAEGWDGVTTGSNEAHSKRKRPAHRPGILYRRSR